jgi:hypothetical protein
MLVIISSRHPFIQSACLHCAHQTVDYGNLIHIMIKDNYIDVCMQNCNMQTVITTSIKRLVLIILNF